MQMYAEADDIGYGNGSKGMYEELPGSLYAELPVNSNYDNPAALAKVSIGQWVSGWSNACALECLNIPLTRRVAGRKQVHYLTRHETRTSAVYDSFIIVIII